MSNLTVMGIDIGTNKLGLAGLTLHQGDEPMIWLAETHTIKRQDRIRRCNDAAEIVRALVLQHEPDLIALEDFVPFRVDEDQPFNGRGERRETMKQKENIFKMMFILMLLILFTACPKQEESQILSEPAYVMDTIFMPSQHGSGTGLSMKGTLTFTSVYIEEKYAIVFECQHGKFVIEGSGDRYKNLWQRLKKGTKVNVSYREIYRVDNSGKRTLVKYDFIDAN